MAGFFVEFLKWTFKFLMERLIDLASLIVLLLDHLAVWNISGLHTYIGHKTGSHAWQSAAWAFLWALVCDFTTVVPFLLTMLGWRGCKLRRKLAKRSADRAHTGPVTYVSFSSVWDSRKRTITWYCFLLMLADVPGALGWLFLLLFPWRLPRAYQSYVVSFSTLPQDKLGINLCCCIDVAARHAEWRPKLPQYKRPPNWRLLGWCNVGFGIADVFCGLCALPVLLSWRHNKVMRPVLRKAEYSETDYRCYVLFWPYKTRSRCVGQFGKLASDLLFGLMSVFVLLTLIRAKPFVRKLLAFPEKERKRWEVLQREPPLPTWYDVSYRSLIALEFLKVLLAIICIPFSICLLLTVYRIPSVVREFGKIDRDTQRKGKFLKKQGVLILQTAMLLVDIPFFLVGLIVIVSLWRTRAFYQDWKKIEPNKKGERSPERRILTGKHFMFLLRDILFFPLFALLVTTVYRLVGALRQLYANTRDIPDPNPVVQILTAVPVFRPGDGWQLNVTGSKPRDFSAKQIRLDLVGDAFWKSFRRSIGAAPHMVATTVLPVNLVPKFLPAGVFRPGEEAFECCVHFRLKIKRSTIIKKIKLLDIDVPLRLLLTYDGVGTLFAIDTTPRELLMAEQHSISLTDGDRLTQLAREDALSQGIVLGTGQLAAEEQLPAAAATDAELALAIASLDPTRSRAYSKTDMQSPPTGDPLHTTEPTAAPCTSSTHLAGINHQTSAEADHAEGEHAAVTLSINPQQSSDNPACPTPINTPADHPLRAPPAGATVVPPSTLATQAKSLTGSAEMPTKAIPGKRLCDVFWYVVGMESVYLLLDLIAVLCLLLLCFFPHRLISVLKRLGDTDVIRTERGVVLLLQRAMRLHAFVGEGLAKYGAVSLTDDTKTVVTDALKESLTFPKHGRWFAVPKTCIKYFLDMQEIMEKLRKLHNAKAEADLIVEGGQRVLLLLLSFVYWCERIEGQIRSVMPAEFQETEGQDLPRDPAARGRYLRRRMRFHRNELFSVVLLRQALVFAPPDLREELQRKEREEEDDGGKLQDGIRSSYGAGMEDITICLEKPHTATEDFLQEEAPRLTRVRDWVGQLALEIRTKKKAVASGQSCFCCGGDQSWSEKRVLIYTALYEGLYDLTALIALLLVVLLVYRIPALVASLRRSRHWRHRCFWNLGQVFVDLGYVLKSFCVLLMMRHAFQMLWELLRVATGEPSFKNFRYAVDNYFGRVFEDLLYLFSLVTAWDSYKFVLASAIWGLFTPGEMLSQLVTGNKEVTGSISSWGCGRLTRIVLILICVLAQYAFPFFFAFYLAPHGHYWVGLYLLVGFLGATVVLTVIFLWKIPSAISEPAAAPARLIRWNWYNISVFLFLGLELFQFVVLALSRHPQFHYRLRNALGFDWTGEHIFLIFGHHSGLTFGFWVALALCCVFYLVASLPVVLEDILEWVSRGVVGKWQGYGIVSSLFGQLPAIIIVRNMLSVIVCANNSGGQLVSFHHVADLCWSTVHGRARAGAIIAMVCLVFYVPCVLLRSMKFNESTSPDLDIRYVELYSATLTGATLVITALSVLLHSDLAFLVAEAVILALFVGFSLILPKLLGITRLCSVPTVLLWRVCFHAMAAWVAICASLSRHAGDTAVWPAVLWGAGWVVLLVVGIVRLMVYTRSAKPSLVIEVDEIRNQLLDLEKRLAAVQGLLPAWAGERKRWKRSVSGTNSVAQLAECAARLEYHVHLCYCPPSYLSERQNLKHKLQTLKLGKQEVQDALQDLSVTVQTMTNALKPAESQVQASSPAEREMHTVQI